jgi:hypothetical protein
MVCAGPQIKVGKPMGVQIPATAPAIAPHKTILRRRLLSSAVAILGSLTISAATPGQWRPAAIQGRLRRWLPRFR